MKQLKHIIAAFAVVVFGGLALVPAGSAAAALDPLGEVCTSTPDSAICKDHQNASGDDLIADIVNTLLFIVGALSVVMVIVGGIFYAISTGDAGKVARAKNTITYAIVGLVVSFLAYAIINWVFNLF